MNDYADMAWHVRVVLDNEQATQEHARDVVATAYAHALGKPTTSGPDTLDSRDMRGLSAAGEAIRDLAHDYAHGVDTREEDSPLSSMASELVGVAMALVEWRTVAADYLDDVRTEALAYVEAVAVHYGGDSADADTVRDELFEQSRSEGMFDTVGAYDYTSERVATAIVSAASDTFGTPDLSDMFGGDA